MGKMLGDQLIQVDLDMFYEGTAKARHKQKG